MTKLLFRISQFPNDDDLAAEILDRVLVALVLDLEVDVVFYASGLQWLQSPTDAAAATHQKLSQIKQFKLFGVGKMIALLTRDDNIAASPFELQYVPTSELTGLLSEYDLVL